jgi:hypothetical protein
MIKKYSILLSAAVIFFLGCHSAVLSQDGFAGMPGAFLHMGVGSRAMGMGKAYTALAADASALYWNPAALADRDPYQVYFMHAPLFYDTNFDYLGFSAPTKNMGSFGLGLLALNSGNFDQRNELNQELGTFNIMDLAFLASWSKEFFKGIAVGFNYKFVTQRMLDYSGIGHGLDFGFKSKLVKKIDVGLAIVNLIQPKIKMVNESQSIPTQVRIGAATALFDDKLILSSDIAKIVGWGSTFLNMGAELKVLHNISLRAGINNGRLTFGTGFVFNKAGVDYSHHNVSELGNNHRFALKYAFGGFGIKAEAHPNIFSPMGEQNVSRIKLHVNSRKEIHRWHFEITDPTGNIVRSFSENGKIPEEIVWDGRKDSGVMAEDGNFNYRFVIWTEGETKKYSDGPLVSIDSKSPDGSLSLGSQK